MKPADKGGGIFIRDCDTYDSELMRQLQNATHYRPLPSDPLPDIRSKIQHVTNRAKALDMFTDKE